MQKNQFKIVLVLMLILVFSSNLMAFDKIPLNNPAKSIFVYIISGFISQHSVFDFNLIYAVLSHPSEDLSNAVKITGHLVIPRLSDRD
ncbi:MAG: hypothetical protein ABIN18_22450 [Pseudomonadota bacterium]